MIKLFGNLFGFLAFAAFAVVIMRKVDATDDKSGAELVLAVSMIGCPTREQVLPLFDSIARLGRLKATLENEKQEKQCYFFGKGETVIEDDHHGEYTKIHSPYFHPEETFWIIPSRSDDEIWQDATRNDERVQKFARAGSAAIIINGTPGCQKAIYDLTEEEQWRVLGDINMKCDSFDRGEHVIIHGHSPTGVSLHSQEDPTATVYWVPKNTVGALN